MIKGKRKIKKWSVIGRLLSVTVMIFALIFLTTANYFIDSLYNIDELNSPISEKSADSNEEIAGSPGSTEEKTSSGSISVIEEYLHKDSFDFSLFNSSESFLHKIAVSQKIELVHFKLLSPPPELG